MIFRHNLRKPVSNSELPANGHLSDKPEIIEGPQADIMSWMNHKTEITCKAEGTPIPEITWSRNGTVVSSTQFRGRVSTLMFTPQEAEDFGVYVCMANNVLGTASRNVTVQLLGNKVDPVYLSKQITE